MNLVHVLVHTGFKMYALSLSLSLSDMKWNKSTCRLIYTMVRVENMSDYIPLHFHLQFYYIH